MLWIIVSASKTDIIRFQGNEITINTIITQVKIIEIIENSLHNVTSINIIFAAWFVSDQSPEHSTKAVFADNAVSY